MVHRITNGFKQFRDRDLIGFALRVKGGMQNNAVFPQPPAALSDLEKILPEYQDVNFKAGGGDEVMRFNRKAIRAKVIALLSDLPIM